MLLGAAAEGAAPDVVPQLLDQLGVLLLDLLRKLLSSEKNKKQKKTCFQSNSVQKKKNHVKSLA